MRELACLLTLLMSFFVFLVKGYADIASWQEQKRQTQMLTKQATPPFKKTSSSAKDLPESFIEEERCPREGCIQGADLEETPLKNKASLLVFISFSMPESSLLTLSKELETCQGTFVIRGLPENSFETFFHRWKHLQDLGMKTPLSIDPDLFEKYHIKEVPTIILQGAKTVDKLTGNLPIESALTIFAERGENKTLARDLLDTLCTQSIHLYLPEQPCHTQESL